MWVNKVQHQIEVSNSIYIAPNMTALVKMTFWLFIQRFLTKRDVVDKMLPFAKRDISEWGSRYEAKGN